MTQSKLLVGKFFHVFENGIIERQGRVKASGPNGYYLVQWFSWLDGRPNKKELMPLDELAKCAFYDTDKAMRHAYYRASART